jgi:hypothetical protein
MLQVQAELGLFSLLPVYRVVVIQRVELSLAVEAAVITQLPLYQRIFSRLILPPLTRARLFWGYPRLKFFLG